MEAKTLAARAREIHTNPYISSAHSFVSDIGECSSETNGCNENAECNNTLGSCKCICKDGFHGKGTNFKGYLVVSSELMT